MDEARIIADYNAWCDQLWEWRHDKMQLILHMDRLEVFRRVVNLFGYELELEPYKPSDAFPDTDEGDFDKDIAGIARKSVAIKRTS